MYWYIYKDEFNIAIPDYIQSNEIILHALNAPRFRIPAEEDNVLSSFLLPTNIDGNIIDWKKNIREPPIEFQIIVETLNEILENGEKTGEITIDGNNLYYSIGIGQVIVSENYRDILPGSIKKPFYFNAFGIKVARAHDNSYLKGGDKIVCTGFTGSITYAPLVVFKEGIFSVFTHNRGELFNKSVFDVENYYPLMTFPKPIEYSKIISCPKLMRIYFGGNPFEVDFDYYFKSSKGVANIPIVQQNKSFTEDRSYISKLKYLYQNIDLINEFMIMGDKDESG